MWLKSGQCVSCFDFAPSAESEWVVEVVRTLKEDMFLLVVCNVERKSKEQICTKKNPKFESRCVKEEQWFGPSVKSRFTRLLSPTALTSLNIISLTRILLHFLNPQK